MVDPVNLNIPGLPYLLLALGAIATITIFAVVLDKAGNARKLIEQGDAGRQDRFDSRRRL